MGHLAGLFGCGGVASSVICQFAEVGLNEAVVSARSREPIVGAYGSSHRAHEPAHNEHEDADREKAVTDDMHQKTLLPCRPGGFPTVKYIGGYAENRGDRSGRQHHPP
jgi:hypothetical protein